MVIVSVAQDHGIHGCQIDAQLFCIFQCLLRGTQIHQKLVMVCLNVERETVRGRAAMLPLRVFHQIDDSHSNSPPLKMKANV